MEKVTGRLFILFFCVIFLLSVLTVISPGFAKVYYVATSGSNSNDGSPSEPWRSIQYAADQVDAGDTVLVLEGYYKEFVSTEANGDPDASIVFKSSGKVVMNGFQIRHDFVNIEGFEITEWPRNFGIQLKRSSSNCQIRGNVIYYKGEKIGLGIWGKNHLIENNDISGLSCDAMRVFGSGHIIRKNYIHDFIDLGTCHVDVFQSFSENNDDFFDIIFEQNLIENFQGQMFMIDNTKQRRFGNITVRNNVYINARSAGQTYIGPVYIYNNTYIRSGFGNSWAIMLRFDPERGDPEGTVIKNNIFYNCGNRQREHGGWYKGSFNHKFTADHNLIFPKRFGFNETNGINGKDPQFISESDFRLAPGSPAINSGTQIPDFANDKDGNPRIGKWDLGAFEYISPSK